MAVVRGTKVFQLFDPLQSSLLYHGIALEHSKYNATVRDNDNNFSIAVNRVLLNRTRLKTLPVSETAMMALIISSYSPVNLRRPDLKSFPDFSKASSVHIYNQFNAIIIKVCPHMFHSSLTLFRSNAELKRAIFYTCLVVGGMK